MLIFAFINRVNYNRNIDFIIKSMQIEKTDLVGAVIITPDVFSDDRGFFFESFQEARYQEILGKDVHFVQDNVSRSKKGVLRGLHYQAPPFGQAKLVSVLEGSVLDVAVDIRQGSPTYGKHVVVELSDENHKQFFIPEGFAHGFVVTSETALFAYKCTNVYSKEHDRGIVWSDPALGIEWKVTDPIISPKDSAHPVLADAPKEYFFK